jgi:hypothetical protein
MLGTLSLAVVVAATACAAVGRADGESAAGEPSEDVWAFYNGHFDTDRSTLTEDERGLLAILDLRQEVASGGFDSYFSGWGGNTAVDALDALPAALGTEWADVLRDAMGLLGSPYPNDPDERYEILQSRDNEYELDALDARLNTLEATSDVDARLGAALAGLHP